MPAPSAETTLLRVALPDRPGALASLARCLGACGVDIQGVEVVGHEDGVAIDDILVHGGDLEPGARRPRRRRAGARPRGGREPARPGPPDGGGARGGARRADRGGRAGRDRARRAVRIGAGSGGGAAPALGGRRPPLASTGATVPGPRGRPRLPAVARAARAPRAGRPLAAAAADEGWAPPAWREALPGRQVAAVPVVVGDDAACSSCATRTSRSSTPRSTVSRRSCGSSSLPERVGDLRAATRAVRRRPRSGSRVRR
ncbi:MAG: hypothetical protein V9F04_14875 [Dermatophilaceae bacterium]